MHIAQDERMNPQQPAKPPTHPELAQQPNEPKPRSEQSPSEAEEISRKAEQHTKTEPKQRAR